MMTEQEKKQLAIIALIIFIIMLSIGYAILSTTLTINGSSKISGNTWNIHFENVSPKNGSVEIGEGDQGAVITQNKTNEVTYIVTLSKPGDFYEFNVDAVNSGTIDGMVDSISSTIKIGEAEETPITNESLPSYLSYTATYSDDTPILQYHDLKAGESETYKVRVEFKKSISNNELPEEDQTIEIKFRVDYIQSDDDAINVNHPFSGILYTANIFDNNYTTGDNGTNTSVVRIGQSIPNGITTYQTPELAMAALKEATGGDIDRSFFLKHTLTNNIVTDSYVGFVISDDMVTTARNTYITNCNNNQECIDSYQGMTAGTYYLKGKKTYEYVNNSWQCISEFDDGNGNCLDPEYNTNKQILLSAFGNSNCTDNSQEFRCHAGILHAYADSNGYVYFFDSSWCCRIDKYGVADCWDGG